MTLQVIGLCRFSYPAIGGFQVEHETIEDRIAYLYGTARLEERFRLMETVALPCIKAQTDEDFELIIVVGDQFPKEHSDRLHDITADIPQVQIIAEPPRPQREVMKEIFNKARKDPSLPCLQFRHDDDDAFAVDFIERLRVASCDAQALTEQHKAVNFDWNKGIVAEFGQNGIASTDIFRQLYPAAMGMQIRGNCPLTIMNFAHEKISRFMPVVSYADPQMFVRSHNASNDSRQKPVKKVPVKPIDFEQAKMFKERFAIDIDRVSRVFFKAITCERSGFVGFPMRGTVVSRLPTRMRQSWRPTFMTPSGWKSGFDCSKQLPCPALPIKPTQTFHF